MKTIVNGIIKGNPVFVLILGLCSALAVTKTFESAYTMGLCVIVVLVLSEFFVSLIKKIVPNNIKIPVYILIIGIFVTLIEILLKEYVPGLRDTLDIYLNLIVVNCIVLGRCLVVASKKNVGHSVLDAIGIGIGYTLAISLIALVRELLGTNSLTIMMELTPITGYRIVFKDILPLTSIWPITIFKEPAGAFLTIGFLMALFNYLRKGRKNESV